MPRQDIPQRSILAQLDFEFPHADAGDLKVLHTRLAPAALKSSLVREHIELPAQGYAKLVETADYTRAFGDGWLERTQRTFRVAAARVLGFGKDGRDAALAEPDRDARIHVDLNAAHEALVSARVLALRARHLDGPDIERLLSEGELGIRRNMALRRKRADHRMLYDLAILEASLLVEYALRNGEPTLVDEEGAKLVRFAAGQLGR